MEKKLGMLNLNKLSNNSEPIRFPSFLVVGKEEKSWIEFV
jgi:hypothetical protein